MGTKLEERSLEEDLESGEFPDVMSEELQEDVSSLLRTLKEINDDPNGGTIVLGTAFGMMLQSLLEKNEVSMPEIGTAIGLPFCLPFLEDGEWDGVSFQYFVLGIGKLTDKVHVHEPEDGDKEDEDGDES